MQRFDRRRRDDPFHAPRQLRVQGHERVSLQPGERDVLGVVGLGPSQLLGWDKTSSGLGERVHSLRERLPADLLEGPGGPDLRAVPGRADAEGPPVFTSVYQTHDEWAAEISSRTVHAVMHIGWVPDDSGSGYHAQMAVLVKPNGRLGKAYMAAILPFRRVLVYPLLLRSIGRRWRARSSYG